MCRRCGRLRRGESGCGWARLDLEVSRFAAVRRQQGERSVLAQQVLSAVGAVLHRLPWVVGEICPRIIRCLRAPAFTAPFGRWRVKSWHPGLAPQADGEPRTGDLKMRHHHKTHGYNGIERKFIF